MGTFFFGDFESIIINRCYHCDIAETSKCDQTETQARSDSFFVTLLCIKRAQFSPILDFSTLFSTTQPIDLI